MAEYQNPFLNEFYRAQQHRQQQATGQLAQLQGVLGIQQAMMQQQERQRALAEQQQLSGVLQQTGGDPDRAIAALLQAGTPASLALAAKLKDLRPKPQAIGAGGLLNPDGTITPPAARPTAPQEFAPPEIVRLQKALDGLPQGHPNRVAIEQRIRMLTERQPGVTVNMPQSSDLMQRPDGSYVRVRIGKDGKVEEIPLGNVRPPASPSERKAEEESKSAVSTLENVRSRITRMGSLIQQGGVTGSVVGPLGAAGRVAETGIGMVRPDAPTPAIDYDNEKALLLADVRKLVEKDPNLSNQERQTLYQTLGGGIWQTPGSAVRTLGRVVEYVESKQPRAAAGGAVPPPAQRKAGQVYQTPRGPMKWTGTGWLPEN